MGCKYVGGLISGTDLLVFLKLLRSNCCLNQEERVVVAHMFLAYLKHYVQMVFLWKGLLTSYTFLSSKILYYQFFLALMLEEFSKILFASPKQTFCDSKSTVCKFTLQTEEAMLIT